MIKPFCLTIFLTVWLAASLSVKAQTCPPNLICLTREQADKTDLIVQQYPALKSALDAAQKQIAAMQLSIADRDALLLKKDEIIGIDAQIAAIKDKYIAIRDQIDALKDDLIKNLEKKIANNKSFWQKLLTKLQILYYALGAAMIIAK